MSAQTIAQNIINQQQSWLSSADGQEVFYSPTNDPNKILSHSTGFDWWIFPGYTTNNLYKNLSIPTYKPNSTDRKAVYGILANSHQFMDNYEHCLRKYFQCMIDNPNHMPFDMRMHKVFESMRNIGFNNINQATLSLAKKAIEGLEPAKYNKIKSSIYYKSHFEAFEKRVGIHPPPYSPPIVTRTHLPSTTKPEKFERRQLHENALLRFLVRKFNNSATEQCSIGKARFVKDSPLHLIARGSHEDARTMLLKSFEDELRLMKDKASPYFAEIIEPTTTSGQLPTAKKQNIATQFIAGLESWITALEKPNALRDYAESFKKSKNNAKILTTLDFDTTQLDPVLKAKAKAGPPVGLSEDTFKFQLSTTSCQIATPQGLPLTNSKGTLGSEFSLNSFCYPNFKKFFSSSSDQQIIEKEITAQFTLALKNLQSDIKPPKEGGLFMVVPPGAFVRKMTVPAKNRVAQIIIRSLKTALIKVNDPSIKVQFSGSQKDNNDIDDFGWGKVLKSIALIADKKHPFTPLELLSQAQYCKENNIAFQVPIMGDPGAIGNGASGPRANSATDEYVARATGGMHCITLNTLKNPGLIKRTSVISLLSPTPLEGPAPPTPLTLPPPAQQLTPPTPPTLPPPDQPQTPTPPPSNSPIPISAEQLASLKESIKSYIDKKIKSDDPVKALIDEQINSQIRVADPKGVYSGCGLKATRNPDGNLVIDEIFNKEIIRFNTTGAGNYSQENQRSMEGKVITKVNGVNVKDMEMEDVAEAFHNPNSDTNFTLKDGNQEHQVTCKAPKDLFVTRSCSLVEPKLGEKSGTLYNFNDHGIEALDPEIKEKFYRLSSAARN